MNRPTRPWRYLTTYILEIVKDRDVKYWHNVDSSLKIVLLKFEIDIFDSLKIMHFSES